jgi:hypothetical protein
MGWLTKILDWLWHGRAIEARLIAVEKDLAALRGEVAALRAVTPQLSADRRLIDGVQWIATDHGSRAAYCGACTVPMLVKGHYSKDFKQLICPKCDANTLLRDEAVAENSRL